MNMKINIAIIGTYLQRYGKQIQRLQWIIIFIYAFLILVPVFLTLPPTYIRFLENLTLAAQFIFWGVWWPFVLLSIVFFGRIWCGILCPEGALTEFASKHGLGKSIPRWMRFKGWPFIMFSFITIYGQMISVYQYPKPALLILGGSTIVAIIIGLIYGKSNRVWCKYLCPVNGVFAVLAKLAPIWYKPDKEKWRKSPLEVAPIKCPTILPLRTMDSASGCHMCGRCSGYKDSIVLTMRSPNNEILQINRHNQSIWESFLIIYGLLGISLGAFNWSTSNLLQHVKIFLATWFINNNIMWPFATNAPWWIFTNYPAYSDVFSWLDGILVIGYIVIFALCIGSIITLILCIVLKILGKFEILVFNHLSQSLIPIAGCGVFIGLFSNTISILREENIIFTSMTMSKFILLWCASIWSVYLSWQIIGRYSQSILRKVISFIFLLIVYGVINYSWVLLFTSD